MFRAVQTASKSSPKLLAAVCAATIGVAGWSLLDSDSQETKGMSNRFWIERMPTSQRDVVGNFTLIDSHRHGKFGTFGAASKWRVQIEAFLWEKNGEELDFRFPQDGEAGSVQVRTWECEGEAPAPFELCLELSAHGRSKVLYSMHDWEFKIDSTVDAPLLVQLEGESEYLPQVQIPFVADSLQAKTDGPDAERKVDVLSKAFTAHR